MSDTNAVQVTTVVNVDPTLAFRIFTEEIDAWWRRGRRFRYSADAASTLRFEDADRGGRLVEILDGSGVTKEHGRVSVWKPGEQLVYSVDEEQFGVPIEVDVRFEPHGDGTRVSVEQRGFDAVAADARARHGLEGGAFLSMMGLVWGDLLTSHRLRCQERTAPTPPRS